MSGVAWRRRGVGIGPLRLLRTWRVRQAGALLLSVAVLVGAIQGALAPAVTALGLGLGWFLLVHSGGRIRRAAAGVRGERAVAATLGRSATVVFGWQPPGARFDVDVVVTWPALAAVEVKHAAGRVGTRDDGSVRVGGAWLPGLPMRQAVRGAASLRRHLGVDPPVTAVLCVTGMSQRPRLATSSGVPVVVCSQRHLRRVLRRLPRSDRRDADAWVERLETPD